MEFWKRHRLWLAFAFGVLLVAVAAIVLRAAMPESVHRSPTSTREPWRPSLLNATSVSRSHHHAHPSWVGGGVALLWVAVGGIIAFLAVLILGEYRHLMQ